MIDLTNANIFDPQFTEALVAGLAAYIAIPLTGDKTLYDRMVDMAMKKIVQARISDGNEGTATQNFQAAWINIRTASFDWYGAQGRTSWANPGWWA